MLAGELYDPGIELVALRSARETFSAALNATGDGEADERRRILRELFCRWRLGVDAAAFLLRLRLQHRAWRARVLQFQLRRARCVPRAHRQLHPLHPGVQILPPLHPFDAQLRRRLEYGKPVEIGADVWVGGAAIILAGVRIGSRAVIGAGSVVTRDVPEAVFAAGNPRCVIREITDA